MKRKGGSQQQPSIRNFFTAKAGTSQPQGQHAGNVEPPSKKPKQSNDAECIIVLDDDEPQDRTPAAAAAHATDRAVQRQASDNAHVGPRAVLTRRDATAHGMAQAKLVSARSASRDLDEAAEQQQQQQQQLPARGTGRQAPAPKYTPLEQQVVALKAAHPGVLLLVEVGYKMRMFGQDAEVAAKELGIACFFDHNFMTASFPVPRLSIHVRRLVAAGHKVGVVRQTESAALKAAGDNKSAPFTRSLTGLFTAATLEAAEKADKLDEATYMEVSQELEAMLGGGARSPAANYVLVVAQDMPAAAQQQQAQQSLSSAASKVAAAAAAGGASGLLGLLAVDAGSGDIAYGLGSVESSAAAAGASSADPNSSSGENSAGGGHRTAVMPLEAVLLSLTPSDIVLCEPVAAATEQMLKYYMAGASRHCRLERLQPQQWKQQRQGQSGSKVQSSSGQHAGSYLDAGLINDLVDFFSEGAEAAAAISAVAAAAAGSSRNPASTTPSAAADVDADSKQDASTADSLQFILSLPQPVLAAVAGGLAYLKPFGLSEVLRCTSSYRGLGVGGAMTLDGSALRQLEVLESGAESAPQLKGSLLHVLDRCSTAAGGRMLRRWLAAPLADRNTVIDRQQAVQVLLDRITGNNSEQQPQQQGGVSSSSVLQHLPKWLSSTRQDLERALARVAAGTAAPAEAVGLWSRLAQLPSALHLPMKQQQAVLSATHANADSDAAGSAPSSELDLDSLSAAVPSRLLVSLLAAAAGPDVAGPAAEVLGSLDTAAAAKNDFLALFNSQKHFPEVFACKAAVSGAEAHLQDLLPKLAAAAGVRSLSYVSIQNQGNYLLELPAARTDVPQGWDKVCATKKVCRYHPTEVKQGMAALARAQEQLQAACAAAWAQLLKDFTAAHHAAFRAAVAAVAQLDALHGLAVVASSPGYCRPQFVDEGEPQQLCITDGKHPMLDLALDGAAVPNSLDLRWDGTRAAVITGPNMGGKSVLMRQAALIVIMAQLGSWVPASSCVLSVFDGVYCRMGASDCLMLGRSTFAEELGEASHILAAATNRSLVIMDELGRGTATHDGVAIACATLEHLVSHTQCLSLFVTHYPEVASLASSRQQCAADKRVAAPEAQAAVNGDAAAGDVAAGSSEHPGSNSSGSAGQTQADTGAVSRHVAVYHMSYVRQDTLPQQAAAEAAAMRTSNGPSMAAATAASHDASKPAASEAIPVITFLYKLAEGAADESFGLNVAQMAGLPGSVVQRAAVVARLLKARLGMQQQNKQPPVKHHWPAEQQQDSKQDTDSCQLVQLTQRVCQALRAAQQGEEANFSDLLQLQASATHLIASTDLKC